MAKKEQIKTAAGSFFNEEPEVEVAEPKKLQEVKEAALGETIPKAPEGYKINPVYIEVKSKRVQFVFQPSLLKAAKAEAKRRKTSLNELIHIALRKLLEEQE